MSTPVDTARRGSSATLAGRDASSSALLAAIVESSDYAILSKTLDGIITSWNPAAERMYGYAADEAIGRPISIVIPPDRAAEAAEILERIADGQRVEHRETVRLRKDGTLIPVSVTVSPVHDGEGRVVGASSTARDITEQLKANMRVLAVSELAQTLIETSSEPLVTINPEGRITGVNDATVELTGHPRESLIGTDFSERFADTTSTGPGDSTTLAEGSMADYTLPICHRKGRPCDVLLEDLEARTHDLASSNAELEQFAYIASHDLSEPLRAISGPIALLARRYEGQLDEQADEYIRFAVDGCQRMQAIINDLLAYSRVGRREGSLDPVDCNLVVGDAVAALALAIDESGAEVCVEELPTVRAEATQLSLVFQNLISNALKFVAPGTRPRVVVSAERAGLAWRFSVMDNGIGVDPKHYERIFGMFKRLHGRDDYPGTGIGLAVVKKIVERHDGVVGVANGDPGGSRFWFTLPD